ncbi:MAG TPA: DUF2784 domain-containing protein [Bryobacteraceae bacterium]|nr:DUF2784 domain-containing protein [Bryobacteraceae bacterium]
MYAGLAAVVLTLHFLWIIWILAGWVFTRGRPVLTAVHVAALAWGIAVELGPWPCPLTLLEQWLEVRAGSVAYQQGFLVHYLDKLVYPDLPEAVLGWVGAGVCSAILGVYGWRLVRRIKSDGPRMNAN